MTKKKNEAVVTAVQETVEKKEVKEIKELTPDQVAQLDVYRDKFIGIGLKTSKKIDKAKAKKAITLAYEKANLKCPKDFYWEGSPYAGAKKAGELLGVTPQEALGYVCYGSQEAGWLSQYAYLEDVCGLDCSLLHGLIGCLDIGWWWPMDNAVVVTPLPTEIHRDVQGRLHRPDGFAITYPDGWGVYSFHGVRVVEPKLVEKMIAGNFTGQEIMDQTNVELRRIMLSRVGAERLLKDDVFKFTESHKDESGKLYRSAPINGETITLVQFSCPSTGREYILRVDPAATTAHGAIASTFGLQDSEYVLEAEG
jgi:hypothetical protein